MSPYEFAQQVHGMKSDAVASAMLGSIIVVVFIVGVLVLGVFGNNTSAAPDTRGSLEKLASFALLFVAAISVIGFSLWLMFASN